MLAIAKARPSSQILRYHYAGIDKSPRDLTHITGKAVSIHKKGNPMPIDLILGAITLAIVLVYLLAVLARPERY
jgi:hypothetical protein